MSTGRDIFYSICNWGEEDTWKWASSVGNSWRTTEDISNDWTSVEYNFKLSQVHFEISGPGGWNDPDMLEVGNSKLTIDEEKTHFALWALAKAPLIIGADLTTINPASLEIIKNKNLISVNQDPNSKQATCRLGCDYIFDAAKEPSVFATTVTGGDTVAIIVNWRFEVLKEFSFTFGDLGIVPRANQIIKVVDQWTNELVGHFTSASDVMTVTNIAKRGNFTYRFTTIDRCFIEKS